MENWGPHLTESYACLVFALLEVRGEFELFGALNCVKIVPDMRWVVQSKTHCEYEDDGGGDLYSEAHEVGPSSYIQQGQGNADEDQDADYKVCDQE